MLGSMNRKYNYYCFLSTYELKRKVKVPVFCLLWTKEVRYVDTSMMQNRWCKLVNFVRILQNWHLRQQAKENVNKATFLGLCLDWSWFILLSIFSVSMWVLAVSIASLECETIHSTPDQDYLGVLSHYRPTHLHSISKFKSSRWTMTITEQISPWIGFNKLLQLQQYEIVSFWPRNNKIFQLVQFWPW